MKSHFVSIIGAIFRHSVMARVVRVTGVAGVVVIASAVAFTAWSAAGTRQAGSRFAAPASFPTLSARAQATTTRGYLLFNGGYEDVNYPNAKQTMPTSINDDGLIVGAFVDSDGKSHGFRSGHSNYSQIDIGPGTFTEALGVNNLGQVVGGYVNQQGVLCGFLLNTDSSVATFSYPGAASTSAWRLNDEGQVVGIYSMTDTTVPLDTDIHGFVMENGQFTNINFGNAPQTGSFDINNSGQVVGYYPDGIFPRGYRWQNGIFTPINDPTAMGTAPLGINDLGHIVGLILNANGTYSAFRRVGTNFQVIPPPVQLNFFELTDINNPGLMVGWGN